jgi:nucleoside-diphosphate-sugar epimerase
MDALVTGGAGFIGSHLVDALLAQGMTVSILDNFATGRESNIASSAAKVDLVRGDIRDAETVARAVRGVKAVFHVAALPSVNGSISDPAQWDMVNVHGTVNVLTAARDAGVERLVFSSSSSVYGDTPVLPKREDMPTKPLSPYALQKLAGEHYCRLFHELYGLKTVVLRYFNVFGPRQNPRSQYAAVVPLFVESLLAGKAPTICGDGGQTRDFTFVADVVSANITCLKAPPEAFGDVFNVARGDRISVNGLAETIMEAVGTRVTPVHVDARQGEVRDSQADVAKVRRVLGWQSGVTFREGIERTVRAARSRG